MMSCKITYKVHVNDDNCERVWYSAALSTRTARLAAQINPNSTSFDLLRICCTTRFTKSCTTNPQQIESL